MGSFPVAATGCNACISGPMLCRPETALSYLSELSIRSKRVSKARKNFKFNAEAAHITTLSLASLATDCTELQGALIRNGS